MNLCFMITHLLMLVLGVDSVNNPVDYSGLKFTVDQGAKFKDELTTISNFLNEICRSNINNTRKDYLFKCYIDRTKFGTIPSIYFEKIFHKLSDVMKLRPSYMFLYTILEAGRIHISDVYKILKIIIKNNLSEAIDMCNSKIEQLETNTDIGSSNAIKKYKDFIDCSTELMEKINPYILIYKMETISVNDLSELIFIYLGEFYDNDEYSKLVPVMDAYTYNSYILFTTILKLKDAFPPREYDALKNDSFWNEDKNIDNVNYLISKLTIEMFWYLVGNNKHVLAKIEYCVATSNVEFFNICNIWKFVCLEKKIGIKKYDLLEEIELGITTFVRGELNQDRLNVYKEQLVKTKTFLIKTTEKGYLDQAEKERYLIFCNKIDIAMLEIECAIEDGNYDRDALNPSYWNKLIAESNIFV